MFENIVGKPIRRVIGMMSGTSVDGIDAALVEISGDRESAGIKLCAFENKPYSESIRKKIFELFNPETSTIDKYGYMNFLLGELFADAALKIIEKAGFRPEDIDFIGSHGQTLYHCPEICSKDGYNIRYTVQIGEGAVISARTGIPCVSDFRVADIAVGGHGAPLVPFTEYLLYRNPNKNVLLQNIGGIGNITVIPAGQEESGVFAFDTGPGNMIIDGLVHKLYDGNLLMDEAGQIAKRGVIDNKLLELLKNEQYFLLHPPKSTGRELFGEEFVNRVYNYICKNGVTKEDGIATATYLTAWSIADAYTKYIKDRVKADYLVVGGGGSYNNTLVEFIGKEMSALGGSCAYNDKITVFGKQSY